MRALVLDGGDLQHVGRVERSEVRKHRAGKRVARFDHCGRRDGTATAADGAFVAHRASRFPAKQKAAREPGRAAFEMNCRFSRFRSSNGKASALRPDFELLHECRKPCGNGGRGGVVLVFERSPNRGERDASIATGIHPALARIGNDPPTNPVVDPISCGGEMAHWAASNVSTSRPVNACPLGRVPDRTSPHV